MALCQGKYMGKTHQAPLYRCARCGVHGCNREGCTNQRFAWSNGRCLACAAFNTKKLA